MSNTLLCAWLVQRANSVSKRHSSIDMNWFIALPGCFIGTWLLTGVLRRYAVARGLMDVPNQRSSHEIPTPRGGGLAIVVSFLGGLTYLWAQGRLPTGYLAAYFGAGAWVALVGFLDDHGHIAARWRLLAHFLGAAWFLAGMEKLPPLNIVGIEFDPSGIGLVPVAIYLVWLLNLYNFMDGIDGIAGIEAVTVCVGASMMIWMGEPSGGAAWELPLVMATAAAGFLVWNYPPAKIFMGDAGSGFLGMMLGAMSIETSIVAAQLFWCWLVLLGVFIVDATVTLMRRMFRGERFYEAHRTHAYQHAARILGSHKRVSLAVGTINMLWLLPVAIAIATGRIDGALGLLIAYAPLILLACYFKAGERVGA